LPSQDPTIGDRHSWEVWHQLMLPYAQYAKVGARFVSEFGMQSHPSLALLEAAVPEAERFPGSRTVQWHNKAFGPAVGADGHRRLAVYAADTLRAPHTLAGEVYATQFVQAEAMRHAFEAFRRGWRGPGARACGGALVWQLNDCWPVTSWALIDSAARPKPAWFAVRRALAPLAVALRQEGAEWSAWAVHSGGEALAATALWQQHDLAGALRSEQRSSVTLVANGCTELAVPAEWAARCGGDEGADDDTPLLATVSVSVVGDAAPTARAQAWPEPYRWHRFPDPQIDLQVLAGEGGGTHTLQLQALRPAKGVWIDAPHATLADNFVDLLPGEVRHIAATGALDGLRLLCLNTVQDPAP
jgi:beta-mannosidase